MRCGVAVPPHPALEDSGRPLPHKVGARRGWLQNSKGVRRHPAGAHLAPLLRGEVGPSPRGPGEGDS